MFVLSMPGTTWDVHGCPGTGGTHVNLEGTSQEVFGYPEYMLGIL